MPRRPLPIEATRSLYGAPGNYVLGTNVAGFLKVAGAMLAQGLV